MKTRNHFEPSDKQGSSSRITMDGNRDWKNPFWTCVCELIKLQERHINFSFVRCNEICWKFTDGLRIAWKKKCMTDNDQRNKGVIRKALCFGICTCILFTKWSDVNCGWRCDHRSCNCNLGNCELEWNDVNCGNKICNCLNSSSFHLYFRSSHHFILCSNSVEAPKIFFFGPNSQLLSLRLQLRWSHLHFICISFIVKKRMPLLLRGSHSGLAKDVKF